MAKTREIKGRMKAVGNIKRITKTMQLIANAQFQAASRRATGAKPYTQKIAELVAELAAAAAAASGAGDQPLLRKPDPAVGRELVLVLTANRGLCGGYNANILRTAMHFFADNTDKRIDIEVVGKKGAGFFKFNKTAVSRIHSQFGDKPKFADVEALAKEYMARYGEGKYDAIRLIYMSFETMSRQKPVVMQLLPLEKPAADAGREKHPVAYDFSPAPAQLLAELLPVTVKTRLFQSFNEAIVSEHIARMIAMKAATDAASKMGKALSRKFNRARQTAITTELTEIIGGTAALE